MNSSRLILALACMLPSMTGCEHKPVEKVESDGGTTATVRTLEAEDGDIDRIEALRLAQQAVDRLQLDLSQAGKPTVSSQGNYFEVVWNWKDADIVPQSFIYKVVVSAENGDIVSIQPGV